MFKILLITQDTLLFSDLISHYNKNNIQMIILGKVYDRNIYDITEQHFVSILFFSEGFGLLSETVKQLIQTEFTCPISSFENFSKVFSLKILTKCCV